RQYQVSCRSLLAERVRHFRLGTQACGQSVGDVGKGVPWPAGNYKLTLSKQCLGLVPLRDVSEGIDADEQEEPVRFLERLFEALDGIDGVVRFLHTRLSFARPASVNLFRRFQQRRRELFLLRCGERNHSVAMRE